MLGRVRIWCLVAAFGVFALLVAAPALAFDETGYTDGSESVCYSACHHQVDIPSQGPHGSYSVGTNKCKICHTLHAAAEESVKLLPAATIVDTCFTCHDGTGGQGVYGTILARTGSEPTGGHRFSATNVIPGGDPVTGGDATRVFREEDTGNLICTDCHSAHGSDVVEPFMGERARSVNLVVFTKDRLLRRQPTGAVAPVDEYGSDWCLGCHEGRGAGGMVENHPVDTIATAPAGQPYIYNSLPVLANDGPTTQTVLAPLAAIGGNPEFELPKQLNRGYLMPYPRSPLQDGRGPICQQCHEDSRNVGALDAGGVATASVGELQDPDGLPNDPGISTANPRFQNFPHETENARMLVEAEDDLCMNCHPMNQLP